MCANRFWGASSWVETPALSGSGDLKEQMAVKAGGLSGRAASAAGKRSWSGLGAVLGWEGWRAVTDRVLKVREAVRGVTV
jgi:hypothetical protein